ncbi:hypothetical protein ACC756_39355, partial [Rhizobium ruizarguesonis]
PASDDLCLMCGPDVLRPPKHQKVGEIVYGYSIRQRPIKRLEINEVERTIIALWRQNVHRIQVDMK